ncbi:choline transporter-like 2 isoform X2 [Daktulosphaira vitifoliae]|uniref:choline transporter-like 2 isoform X2 n=1 Tax=Daktulosphaira vitifoliae TaxID=58002 RepID=UPI0021AA0653|nr:choline transporter-like 2 isoform X2 [Daktulosphaira vitifoliae]
MKNFERTYQNVDKEVLTSPTDSAGQVCGYSKNLTNKPYLFFFDITECTSPMILIHGCQTPQVCLETCPEKDWTVKNILDNKSGRYNWPEIQKDLICVSPDLNKLVNSMDTLKNFTSSNLCAKYYLKSLPIPALGYCIPTLSNLDDSLQYFTNYSNIVLSNVIDGKNMVELLKDSKEGIKLMVDDIINSYRYILAGLLVAILISLSYILLMRLFSWVLVWLSLISIICVLGFGTYGSYLKYSTIEDTALEEDIVVIDPSNVAGKQNLINYIDAKLNKKSTWLMFTIVSALALIILFLVIVFLRKRIRLSIALIVEGSRAILEIKTSLIFPLVQWILYGGVIIWFLIIAIFLASMKLYVFKIKGLENDGDCICIDDYYKDGDWCTESEWERYCMYNRTKTMCKVAKCAFDHVVSQDFITGLQAFNIFGMFWLLSFVSAYSQMVLAITFASWYWTFRKKDVPFFALTISVYKTIRYHLGTIAFGSLIIATCNFIRAILEYVEVKLKKYDNSFTRAIFTCMRCFFWMLNKFLRFINRNAYIMCAMHGQNFYNSAKRAFDLLLRNALRVVVLDKVTDFIFFIGKVIITGASIATFYFTFYETIEPLKQFEVFDKQFILNYKWLPMIVVACGSWIISATFFHVYSIAVDTLFLCFLEDSERNDGSADRPYFMSHQLMNLLGTRNVQSYPMH